MGDYAVTKSEGGVEYAFTRHKVEFKNQVAKVLLQWPDGRPMHDDEDGGRISHREIPLILHKLREDDSVRVVVLTGAGKHFYVSDDFSQPQQGGFAKTGVIFHHENTYEVIRVNSEMLETMVSMEKPVIAMVNGDAYAFGVSLALGCDLIVANEDARFGDLHISQTSYLLPSTQPHAGIAPGDGGVILWQFLMGLAKAKEYVLLGKPVGAKELASMGAINAAVPLDRLQDTVDSYVNELLQRPAWALAWTKVAMNKRIKENLNLMLDLSMAFEALSMRARQAKLEGGKGVEQL